MKFSLLLLISTLTFASTGLIERQWALKNEGATYTRRVGEYNQEVVTGVKGVDINQARNLTKIEGESSEVIVAVIDSGLDINHPDLKGRIWENPVCKDLTGDERLKFPCHGINILNNTADLTDLVGHGTFIAGQIAADRNKNEGVYGATHSKIKIMGIKALDEKFSSFQNDGKLVSELIANGVIFATKNGAKVINLSMGLPKIVVTPKVKAAFDYAMDNNVVIVAAAGNNNKNKPVFPCGHNRVLCVGAIDAKGERVSSSNFGHKVDLYAPGENIISTIPVGMESEILRVNNYDTKTGTSYAAPYVSALAGMIFSKNPSLTTKDVNAIILSGARDINGLKVVDFDSSLNSVSHHFIIPSIKNIDEISVSDENEFDVVFEMSSLRDLNENITTAIDDKSLALVSKIVKKAKNNTSLFDYRVSLKFKVMNETINSSQKIALTFTDLNGSEEKLDLDIELNKLIKITNKKIIAKIPAQAITLTNPVIKRSSLQRVLNKSSLKTVQDYFFTDGKNLKKIYLLKETETNFSPVALNLEEDSQISAIMIVDVDFDGVEEYMVYGATNDKKNYFISYFNQDGSAKFSKNYWKLKASRFGGLSFSKGFENYSYLKINTEFGILNLPVFEREWTMPFDDNGLDPIDRLPNTLSKRVYYFLPKTSGDEVLLTFRTINSLANITKIRSLLKLKEYEDLDIHEVILQDEDQKENGRTYVVAQYGVQSNKKSALLEFSSVHSFRVVKKVNKNTEKNTFVRARNLEKTYSDEVSFSTTFERNFIRFSNFDAAVSKIDSGSWSDLLISTIDVIDLKNQNKLFFLESRYNVFAKIQQDGEEKQFSIPVDRESGYPGLAFSQSFQSLKLNSREFGIFTDTKSIYGNTVGVIRFVGDDFIKPLASNFSLPENCVSLGSIETNNTGKLQLHCNENNVSWITEISISTME